MKRLAGIEPLGGVKRKVSPKIAGVDNAAEFERGPQTKVIDLKGRRVIPSKRNPLAVMFGLNFSTFFQDNPSLNEVQ
jgi:hypothetical protein